MPIYAELVVLLLAAFIAGLGLGWLFWGRTILNNGDSDT